MSTLPLDKVVRSNVANIFTVPQQSTSTPTTANDLTNKSYVDAAVAGATQNLTELVPVTLTSNSTNLTFPTLNKAIVKSYRLQPTAATTFNITSPVAGQEGTRMEIMNESLFDVTLAIAGVTFVGSPIIPAGVAGAFLGVTLQAYSATSIGVK